MKSIWQNTVLLPRFEKLRENISCDVLIIGAGMAGLLTAYCLKEKGIDCVVVEQGRIANGTTANTTAKITYQHGLCYNNLLKLCGLENAQMYYKANKTAFDKLIQLAEQYDCDLNIRDNYVYSVENRKLLENEMKALSILDIEAELCDRLKLPLKTVGAVKFSNQAEFNPLKFIKYIVKDLNIYENTKVLEFTGQTVKCDSAQIKAEKIIAATHFPLLNKHGSYFLKLYQHRSYVLALENAENVNGMYVDESKTGMSFRNYKDLLLLGGGGHRTGKNGGNWGELRSFALKAYPNMIEQAAWAAQDCMSLDNVPYIGQYSKSTENLYVATGFNKWGMTGSMVAGLILSGMLTDKTPDFAEAFNPSRCILKPQLAVNGFESIVGLLTPSNPRCPHLGCALKWNSAEHSWDCGCHGSRFSEKGELLDNPATDDIEL